MYQKKGQLIELAMCVADGAAAALCLLIAGLMRYHTIKAFAFAEDLSALFGVVLIAHVFLFYFLKIYDGFFRRNRYLEIKITLKHNISLVVLVTLLAFCLKMTVFTSRLVFGYFFVMNTVALWMVHIFFRNIVRIFHWSKQGARNLMVVTTSDKLEEIVNRFAASRETTWEIAGVVLLDGKPMPEGLSDIPLISAAGDEYLEFATHNVVDEVFIQIGEVARNEAYLKSMILSFEKMGVGVNLNLDLFDLGDTGEKQVYTLERYPVIAFASKMFDYRMVLVKRLVDIAGAIVGLLITFVVCIFLAPILLLESPGPLIFKQKRVGVNGRIFNFYKFRSMYADAEARKKELMEQNEMSGLMFKIENDPRITKVGAFIRKTSIDELPQFWNVLRGDMSLVGTRPPTVDEYEQYNYYQKRRISFRPGITGLWQISGRSDIKDFDEVVKLDLEYIDNWSLMLDIKILLKTVWIVLRGKGAT